MSELNQYVGDALRTESRLCVELQNTPSRLLHAAMGLCTESSEFLDAMKKAVFYGKQIDRVNLIEELGDVMWYFAIACDALEVDPSEVLNINIAKLRKRYPEKFDKELAENRDLEGERQILEKADSTHPI